MGAVLHAEPLVDIAAELHLHEGVVVCVVLSVAALFNWAILAVNFLVARRPAEGEPKVVLSPISSAAAAPTGSASRPQLPHFAVLCVAMGTALQAEPLIAAAADLNIHDGVVALVVFSVAAFFHRAILSLNILLARRPPKREGKILLRQADPAASTAGCHHLARSAFLILAVLTSASWFVEPFAAAAELRLPRALVIASVVFVAALFNVSIHLFRSFFLPRAPTAAAAAASWEGVGAIAVAAIGMGVAACLVAGGAAYGDAPTRG